LTGRGVIATRDVKKGERLVQGWRLFFNYLDVGDGRWWHSVRHQHCVTKCSNLIFSSKIVADHGAMDLRKLRYYWKFYGESSKEIVTSSSHFKTQFTFTRWSQQLRDCQIDVWDLMTLFLLFEKQNHKASWKILYFIYWYILLQC